MRGLHHHHDEGFSLVEVIVAIVILGIVASSALWFFINGMQTTSNLDRQQRAVSIATSAMENTFTSNPQTSSIAGVSGLVIGRSAAEVNAAFVKFSTVDGVAGTYPLSDPAGATGAGSVKVFDTVSSANNVTYDVYTLVGACYRNPAVAGASQPCAKVTGYAGTSEPAAVSAGVSRLLRVIVVVTWKPIGGECDATGGVCSYNVSTLVDASTDLAWNRVTKPVAVDDPDYAYDPVPGNPVYSLNVMDNDILGSLRSNPVQPVFGSTLDSSAGGLTVPFPSDGVLKYTPPNAVAGTWISGHFPFKYQVYDRTGASSIATVTITLNPKAMDDPGLTASQGVPKVLDVLSNDLGSPTGIEIVGGSKLGATISVSGTTLTYTPGGQGTDTFTYRFTTAAADLSSAVATATVNVEPLTAQGFIAVLPYSTTSTWYPISSNLRGSNPAATQITITGVPTPGTGSLRIDGKAYTGGSVTGTAVEFMPPASSAGEWTFPFRVMLNGRPSDNEAQAVIRVVAPAPTFLAQDDPMGVLAYKDNPYVYISQNDTPNWHYDNGFDVSLGNIPDGCGQWDSNQYYLSWGYAQLDLNWKLTNKGQTGCWAEYTVTQKSTGLTSTARITYDVSG